MSYDVGIPTMPFFTRTARRILIGLALLAVIALTACSDMSSSNEGSNAEAKVEDRPGIGSAVRDGKFEFVVKDVQCGESHIGSADFGADAQGQFCLVQMTVMNIGKEPQSFFGSNQYMFDLQGRKFEADSGAAVYLPESKSLYEKLNPGNSVTGTIVFDIPKGVAPTKIELHDSAFSGGVTVFF